MNEGRSPEDQRLSLGGAISDHRHASFEVAGAMSSEQFGVARAGAAGERAGGSAEPSCGVTVTPHLLFDVPHPSSVVGDYYTTSVTSSSLVTMATVGYGGGEKGRRPKKADPLRREMKTFTGEGGGGGGGATATRRSKSREKTTGKVRAGEWGEGWLG